VAEKTDPLMTVSQGTSHKAKATANNSMLNWNRSTERSMDTGNNKT